MAQNNLHVEDLFKSVEDFAAAKILINNVIKTCKDDGLNLTKFTSNSNELLVSIPDNKRRAEVKNLHLFGYVPVERALAIHWNINEDYLSLIIKRNMRKLTKTMLSIISSIYKPFEFTSPFVLEGKQLPETLCHQEVQWDATGIEELENESLLILKCLKPPPLNKQPEVALQICSGNMQQIYRRTPMPKCDFNEAAKQLYWNHTSNWCSPVNLLHFFRTPFPKSTSDEQK